MLGWLLNLVYLAALLAASPLVFWRSWRHGRYRRGWREKLFGSLPVRRDFQRPLVWLHAVSVGEVVLLRQLIQRFESTRSDLQILVTTSTDSGFDVACAKLTNSVVSWLPLDFSWSVRRALHRVQPDLVVLTELELWPNLIRTIGDSGTPLALVNARLSERSFRGYRRLKPLFGSLLRRFQAIAAQNSEYAERFRELGATPSAVTVTGSLKFDGIETDRRNPRTAELRQALGVHDDELVFIAGSTQAPEESAALEAWKAAIAQHPHLRLILVPRHRERFDEVAALVEARGLPLLRRSRASECRQSERTHPAPIILVDTIGELGAVWGLADIAYVGGSLTAGRGGQNMLEPSAYGAAVLVGPHTENFRQVVDSLRTALALNVVTSAAELASRVRQLLDAPDERAALGQRARDVVLPQRGATERTAVALEHFLPSSLPTPRQYAA